MNYDWKQSSDPAQDIRDLLESQRRRGYESEASPPLVVSPAWFEWYNFLEKWTLKRYMLTEARGDVLDELGSNHALLRKKGPRWWPWWPLRESDRAFRKRLIRGLGEPPRMKG